MAGYGPDDPNYYSDSEPTAYAANYGGYRQQPGEPPPEPPTPGIASLRRWSPSER